VTEREAKPVAEALEQLPHRRIGVAAVGALEVAVIDQRRSRVERAAHVIARRIKTRAEGYDPHSISAYYP
jgi:hypothetical protein